MSCSIIKVERVPNPDLDPSAAEMWKVTRPISLRPIVKYLTTFNPISVLRNLFGVKWEQTVFSRRFTV